MAYKLFLTFGEFLDLMLKKKKMTITELAGLTAVKSRTAIHRLLKDNGSLEIIEAFARKLDDCDPFLFSPSERGLLKQSLEVSKYGKSTLYSRSVLLDLFRNNIPQKLDRPVQVIGTSKATTLGECFEAYTKNRVVEVLIFDAPRIMLSETIVFFIHKAADKKISIQQILDIDEDSGRNADIFSSIYKLLNYLDYSAYYHIAGKDPEQYQANSYKDLIVVHKISQEGTETTDLIKIEQDKNIIMLSENPGRALYEFYAVIFEKMKLNAKPVKKRYVHNNPIEKLIEISQDLLYNETNCAEYLIKQNMCVQMIQPDILYALARDAGFFGLSEDHPLIRELTQLMIKRFYNYYQTHKMKTTLFTKRGLLDFHKNRVLSDHVYGLRPFTEQEVYLTLQFILNQLNTNPFFRLYLLNDNFNIGGIEFNYYENHEIYLFDSCSGYDEFFEDGIINAKPILQVFDDFIKNDLIPNHTLPQAETIAFIQSLMKN